MDAKDNLTAATNFFQHTGLKVNTDSSDRFLSTLNFNNNSKGSGKNKAKLKQSFPRRTQNYQKQFPIKIEINHKKMHPNF